MKTNPALKFERICLAIALVFGLCFSLYLIALNRMPIGHDGFHFFYLQYYYLNGVITSGEIPQWMPYVTQGTSAAIRYFEQAGILQQVFFLAGNLIKISNFIPIFYFGFLFDETLLVLGLWLLSKRFVKSASARLFVAFAAYGSSVWFDQPWWNFRFFFAIPLILHFVHSFFESGKSKYVILAGLLLAVQMFGNLPYYISVTSLIVFIYAVFFLVINRKYQRRVQGYVRKKNNWLALFSIATVFILIFVFLRMGFEGIHSQRVGRNLDASVSLDDFLHYGSETTPLKWIELFLGISPRIDYTIYLGGFTAIFFLAGVLLPPKRKSLHIYLVIIFIVLFGCATPVASLFYYIWPTMKFFRHTGCVALIAKPFICLAAGIGVDCLISQRNRVCRVRLAGLGVAALVGAFCVYWLSSHFLQFVELTNLMSLKIWRFYGAYNPEISGARLSRTAFFLAASGFLLIALTVFKKYSNLRKILIAAILIFHAVDLGSYKLLEIRDKTVGLTPEERKMLDFVPMPYQKQRNKYHPDTLYRDSILRKLFVTVPNMGSNFYGDIFCFINGFLYRDDSSTSTRTDEWLEPLDDYIKTYWGPLYQDPELNAKLFSYNLRFPENFDSASKIGGVRLEKIQFFSDACAFQSDIELRSVITKPAYAGDILLLTGSPSGLNDAVVDCSSDSQLSSNARLDQSYEILKFDANHLTLNIPSGARSGWILYSDVWNRNWRAKIDGRPTPVVKTNLAYKAVKVNSGAQKIEFFYHPWPLMIIQYFFCGLAIFWFCVILKLLFSLLRFGRLTI